MRRLLLVLILPLFLANCAEPVWAPDEAVARARYVSSEPPSISLITVVRTLGGEGAHSGLLINGSQRVVFDPAGTWTNPAAPERNDLHYGITPRMEQYYIDYHARETYYVVKQTVLVSPEVAELAIRRAEGNGAVGKALCGTSISAILRDLPGFESVNRSYFPGKIMKSFAELPGVVTLKYTDDSPDDNKPLLVEQLVATP
ncbi:hypothetical protein [Frigidibacter sp. SD6-1]|uniref:hypothetical protein n=1 Tax=Frigidibacter sp. SD6-1 TaxID=3032581 RepID=UPI0024DF5C46|nr:hypothetical protein [Frigidibacter sp. SD6-1]